MLIINLSCLGDGLCAQPVDVARNHKHILSFRFKICGTSTFHPISTFLSPLVAIFLKNYFHFTHKQKNAGTTNDDSHSAPLKMDFFLDFSLLLKLSRTQIFCHPADLISMISKGDTPCTEGADAYLMLLTEEILPAVEETLRGKPKYSALAGYSFGGLFAVYASYHTDAFAKIISALGSFWFPRFMDYMEEHEMQRIPEKMYFSLGYREAFTKIRIYLLWRSGQNAL